MTNFFPHSVALSALLIFCMRITDVSLGTIRTILTVKGRNVVGGMIGLVEVTIFILAISQVLTHLNHPVQVLAYSGGFAAGTILGGYVEKRLALGHVLINVHGGPEVHIAAGELRAEGFGVTQFDAVGMDGSVHVMESLVPRKRYPRALGIIRTVAPRAFIHAAEQQLVGRGQRERLLRK